VDRGAGAITARDGRRSPFILAVASGKGGTGKTAVASSLAALLPEVLAVDGDGDAPNLHLLLPFPFRESALITRPRPVVDPNRCDGCGACARACRFGALLTLGGSWRLLGDLCHGCGLCVRVCPRGALREEEYPVGERRRGEEGDREILEGRLFPGLPNPVPVIEDTVAAAPSSTKPAVIIDCPPGSSCPFVTSVRPAHAVLLVTEPTPFGLADLELALGALKDMGKRVGVLVNRCDVASFAPEELCAREGVPVVGRLPFSRAVAGSYAEGVPPALRDPLWRETLTHLWHHWALKGGAA